MTIEKIIANLSEQQVSEIIKNAEELYNTGALGDCYLNQLVDECLKRWPDRYEDVELEKILVKNRLIEEAYRNLANKYIQQSTLHKIDFPIGDWSDDGHGKCKWFTILSNKSVDELRELHFGCSRQLGFEIGDLCSDYEDSYLNDFIIGVLTSTGIIDESAEEELTLTALFQIWLKIYQYLDPSFSYTIEQNTTIQFGGFDNSGRHLKTPGYGLFY